MGDLGWMDKKGRIWFCGRKNHRVVTEKKPMFSIPCEAIFNNHPRVFRSALVGVGPKGRQRPVICIELEPDDSGKDKKNLKKELLALAKGCPITEDIDTILFKRAFPVDIRHNSKFSGSSWRFGRKRKFDDFVQNPISALRVIPRHCGVPYVRLIPRDSQALISGFLRSRRNATFLEFIKLNT
jgi:acyl-CoA synthetase (AMP-forming)/AMP-acid ligase II